MAWIFLAASAESHWPYRRGLDQSPIVKMTTMPRAFYCHDKPTAPCPMRQSGTTCGHSGAIYCQQSIIIYGGFPCQDLSCAGNGKGLAGERSGLFFEILRLARETNPRFIFLENVPAIRTRGAATVVKELASLRYDCRWGLLSAYDVGAPHKRERWFLLANYQGKRWGQRWTQSELAN
jgi:site-specific DNA-cytosine methylase